MLVRIAHYKCRIKICSERLFAVSRYQSAYMTNMEPGGVNLPSIIVRSHLHVAFTYQSTLLNRNAFHDEPLKLRDFGVNLSEHC